MAELRPRLVGAPPSGPGLAALLRRHVRAGDFVTAESDRRLRAARELLYGVEDIEFCSFVELVGRFLDMMGRPRGRVASPVQQIAALASIFPFISEDSPLYASRRMPGLHRLAAERLSDLRSFGADAVALSDLAGLASPPLAAKLRTLADLDIGMRGVFDRLGREFSADRIHRCLEGELTHRPVKRIIALAGDENPLFENWLAWAAKSGVEVVVFVDWRKEGKIYMPSRRAADRLISPIGEDDLDPAWHDAVFTNREAADAPECTIVSAADPLSECEWALRHCLDLRKHGVLDHQIVVFARDAELYGPLLHAAADRYSVPLKADWSVPLLSNSFARLILDIFKTASGYDIRAIQKLAKSSYLQCGAGMQKELWEQLTVARRTHDRQWIHIREWAEVEAERFPWLHELLLWREEVLSAPAPLGVWLERLRVFPPRLGILKSAASSILTADRDLAAANVLLASLREVALVAQGSETREFSLQELTRLAERTWDEASIAPSTHERLGINFASSTENLTSAHTVIALGMLEGSFPRRRAEDPLLSDADITELRMISNGRVDLPDSFERAAQERDEFLRLVACADRQLWLSTPQADESQDNIPAFYLEELSRALGGRVYRKTFARTELTPEAPDCTNMADLVFAQALAAEKRVLERPTVEAEAAKAKILPHFEKGVPVDELQDALACPFQAVFRHELRVKSVRRRQLISFLRDVPRRAELATAVNADEARIALTREVELVLEEHAPELEVWELQLLRLAAERWSEEWIQREFAARSLWPRVPGSTMTEVSLGEGSLKNEAGRPGETYRYTGKAEAAWEGADFSAISMWLPMTPGVPYQDEEPDLAKENRLKIGLWLMALYGGGAARSAVEVDSAAGPRRLFFLGKEPLPRRRQGEELVLTRVGMGAEYFRPIRDARQEAVRRLRVADAKPTPKEDWCRTCPYGELCRSSSEFGEALDLFTEDGE